MTTFGAETKACLICRERREYVLLGSTYISGPADLDGRPPEMARSTMHAWVQRCPSCGYCAADVSWGHVTAFDIVRSPEYQQTLKDPTYPDLARTFRAAARLLEAARSVTHLPKAGHFYLCAAWAPMTPGPRGKRQPSNAGTRPSRSE